jgi:putative tryptophan/tyrosine transport system substrate-binding protein
MRRREFIALVGSTVAAWPPAARAQQAGNLPVIGYLSQGMPENAAILVAGVADGLSAAGLVQQRDYTTEFRWGRNDVDHLPALVSELVQRRVAVIVCLDTAPTVRAAKAATTEIPIVFALGNDPVKGGLVDSISHPGGNVTGISTMNQDLGAKFVGLLHELLPTAKRFAILVNIEATDSARSLITTAQVGALALGLQTEVVFASKANEIDEALAGLGARSQALIVHADALFRQNDDRVTSMAMRERLPTLSSLPNFTKAGGFMGYGSDFIEAHRQAGLYVGRILKGEKAGDLPVQLGVKFTFAINLKTAKAIGVDIPPTLLARADEVIE